ncbi:D-aminoacyl-tRNA deacylase [Pseudidiomarina mangrovi]|uniref:D-aminoacyl-tRNA deacylase n=1 Tax=Pseudidiomarina mangrovi TaxID=2487133 RepID=UPI000FCB9673|nr:D-aminoacyl-tRNA deacylase [Pseudidiomarina mangrovi]
MIALLQRVTEARVAIAGTTVGSIQQGLLVLLGIERDDQASEAKKLAQRVAQYRLFSDADDKMNLSVTDIAGSVLVVSQFTLAADTNSGRRPSFSSAAAPAQAEPLYQQFVAELQQLGIYVATGQFGADMQVNLTNDGPVTFLLNSKGK